MKDRLFHLPASVTFKTIVRIKKTPFCKKGFVVLNNTIMQKILCCANKNSVKQKVSLPAKKDSHHTLYIICIVRNKFYRKKQTTKFASMI